VKCENFVDWMQCTEHSIKCLLVISEYPICRDIEEKCENILTKPECETSSASSEGECIWVEGNVTLSIPARCDLKVIYLFIFLLFLLIYFIIRV
jgi:hypothetical protein